MLSFSNENMDDDLSHLVDATAGHHQVVRIGSVEDLGRNSVHDPQASYPLVDRAAQAPGPVAESLDDWY